MNKVLRFITDVLLVVLIVIAVLVFTSCGSVDKIEASHYTLYDTHALKVTGYTYRRLKLTSFSETRKYSLKISDFIWYYDRLPKVGDTIDLRQDPCILPAIKFRNK